jgi:hypothetical protein
MPTAFYHAVPAFRCYCPAKVFADLGPALRYARRASATFKVGYAVWRVQGGTLRLVKRFPAGRVRPRD